MASTCAPAKDPAPIKPRRELSGRARCSLATALAAAVLTRGGDPAVQHRQRLPSRLIGQKTS